MALSDNLVAYYKFDESSGNAADATGNGHTGTNSNVTYSSSTAKLNNAAQFNGTSSSIATNLNLNGDFTISGWFYFNSFSTYPWIFWDYASSKYNISYIIYGDTNKVHFNRGNGTTSPADQTFTMTGLSTSTWYHLVLMQSGTTATLYINGTAQPTLTMTYTGTVSGVTSYLGTQDTGSDWFNGAMDEVGFWSRALSSGEVTTLYGAGTPPSYPFGGSTQNSNFLALLGI